jgi:hypothetical protein
MVCCLTSVSYITWLLQGSPFVHVRTERNPIKQFNLILFMHIALKRSLPLTFPDQNIVWGHLPLDYIVSWTQFTVVCRTTLRCVCCVCTVGRACRQCSQRSHHRNKACRLRRKTAMCLHREKTSFRHPTQNSIHQQTFCLIYYSPGRQ